MRFKSAIVYAFSKPLELSDEAIEEKLKALPFKELESTERSRSGYIPPFPHLPERAADLEHFYLLSGRHYFALRTDCRNVKASHINRLLKLKVAKVEKEESRTVYKKEKDTFRDEVIQDLIPTTPIDTGIVYGYINKAKGLLVVEASSHKAAEGFASFFRGAIESLPIVTPTVKLSPHVVMTNWLNNDYKIENVGFNPEDLEQVCPETIGWSATFKQVLLEGSPPVIKYSNAYPADETAIAHIKEGYSCTELRLSIGEEDHAGASLTLSDDLVLKGIKYPPEFDEISSQSADDRNVDYNDEDDEGGEYKSYVWDADAILMSDLLESTWDRLIKSFGGYEAPPVAW